MPNLERINLLIEDLLSGKFEQGKNHLRRVDAENVERFCCLGVACERFIEEYPDALTVEPSTAVYNGAMSYIEPDRKFRQQNVLPGSVAEWFDITATGKFNHEAIPSDDPIHLVFPSIGKVFNDGLLVTCDTLDQLNDAGVKFEDIAGFLQRNVQHFYAWGE